MQHGNTPDLEYRVSPALLALGPPIKDFLFIMQGNFSPSETSNSSNRIRGQPPYFNFYDICSLDPKVVMELTRTSLALVYSHLTRPVLQDPCFINCLI